MVQLPQEPEIGLYDLTITHADLTLDLTTSASLLSLRFFFLSRETLMVYIKCTTASIASI